MARTAVLIGIMSPSSFRASQATVRRGTVSRREAPCQAIGDGLVVGWSVRSQSHETIRGPATNPRGTDPLRPAACSTSACHCVRTISLSSNAEHCHLLEKKTKIWDLFRQNILVGEHFLPAVNSLQLSF